MPKLPIPSLTTRERETPGALIPTPPGEGAVMPVSEEVVFEAGVTESQEDEAEMRIPDPDPILGQEID